MAPGACARRFVWRHGRWPRRREEDSMKQQGQPRSAPERYRIVVRGEFGPLLSTAFDDVHVSAGGGRTLLVATARDWQELYGFMDRLRDHRAPVEEVSRGDGFAPRGPRA